MPHEETEKQKVDIIIAEDEPVNAKLISTLLSRWGYSFFIACNGEEAFNHYTRFGAKLILMDLQMPGMNGIEATLAIRDFEKREKNGFSVPVIALTGYTQGKEQEECLAAGMNEALEKPIHLQKLQTLLKQYFAS